jgi:hypothetical protein
LGSDLDAHNHFDMKYVFLFIASFIIEIASTFYITSVADKNVMGMVFWSFISPFLNLPFLAYQIEAKSSKERILMALVYGIGYASGAFAVAQF